MDKNLVTRLESYSEKHGISNNKMAQAIGYTASVLSQWRKGVYKGDVASVEAKVQAWLELQESRLEGGVVPYVFLKRTERIKTAVHITHEEKMIGLVLGHSGTGKSRTLDEYASIYPNTILIKCDPTMGLSTVITSVARALGLDTKGRLSDVSERLIAELRKRDMIVAFDEADYMTDNVMEWARIAINDKGGTALVFAGLPSIEYRIKSLRGDHRQLENRVGMMLHVDDVGVQDIHEILAAVWPGLDEATEKVFETTARQSLHILVHHIALTQKGLRQSGLSAPSAEFATQCASFLMR
jgi:DNA transposition AAA+ family ATPase